MEVQSSTYYLNCDEFTIMKKIIFNDRSKKGHEADSQMRPDCIIMYSCTTRRFLIDSPYIYQSAATVDLSPSFSFFSSNK